MARETGRSIKNLDSRSSNLLIVGARDPALLESMTIVPGTRRDSKEGEEGKANDLRGHKFFRKVGYESAPGQFGGSLVVDAKSWRSRADRRC